MWTFVQLRTIVQFLSGRIGIWMPMQKKVWNAWLEEPIHLHLIDTQALWKNVKDIQAHVRMLSILQWVASWLSNPCENRSKTDNDNVMSWQSDVNTMTISVSCSVSGICCLLTSCAKFCQCHGLALLDRKGTVTELDWSQGFWKGRLWNILKKTSSLVLDI